MNNTEYNAIILPHTWASLQQHTAARIALGTTGVSMPLKEVLNFKLAHAHARDAVYAQLASTNLAAACTELATGFEIVHSLATDRATYLQRPDLGTALLPESEGALAQHKASYDIAIVLADGLSATAINQHAIPLLQNLLPLLQQQQYRLAPIVIAQEARVAIGDAIAVKLQAKMVLVLIGERPGLSSPDSMGAYLTYTPTIGCTNDARNCVSNIRPQGLSIPLAAAKIAQLVAAAFRLQLTGVALKDDGRLLTV